MFGLINCTMLKRKIKGLSSKQLIIICLSILGLASMYLFQKDLNAFFRQLGLSGYHLFMVERSTRFIVNDLLMILLIYGLFLKKKYIVFAFYVQLAGIIFILVPYMIIKYHTAYNGPLISFMHRLIINPLLLILLIPAFFYQKRLLNFKK